MSDKPVDGTVTPEDARRVIGLACSQAEVASQAMRDLYVVHGAGIMVPIAMIATQVIAATMRQQYSDPESQASITTCEQACIRSFLDLSAIVDAKRPRDMDVMDQEIADTMRRDVQ